MLEFKCTTPSLNWKDGDVYRITVYYQEGKEIIADNMMSVKQAIIFYDQLDRFIRNSFPANDNSYDKITITFENTDARLRKELEE